SEAGAALIEQGVTAGVLEQKTLVVPYGNLATMHKLLGNAEESERFTRLSQNASKPQPKRSQASTQLRRLEPSSEGARPVGTSGVIATPTADETATLNAPTANVGRAPAPQSASSANGASGQKRPLTGRSTRYNQR